MRKIIFASHYRLAEGMKSTAEYILGTEDGIIALNAYISNVPANEELASVIEPLEEEDEVLLFTDIMSGSVNQLCIPYLSNPNVHVISGMSLPVVMSVLMAARGMDRLSADAIRKGIEEAREQLVYVNDQISSSALDEDDE